MVEPRIGRAKFRHGCRFGFQCGFGVSNDREDAINVDVVFEVKGRGKSEKMRKGNIVTEYKVKLVSADDSATLALVSQDRALLEQFPMSGNVVVKIGKCDQTTLLGASDGAGEEEEEESPKL